MNKLYSPGESHARSLIRGGRVNESASWDITPADEDKILGDPPDWSAYGSWHLGKDDSADEKTKAAWKYPFGKGGELYRSALRAIATRAAQNGDDEISQTASALITEIDDAKKSSDRLPFEFGAYQRQRAVAARHALKVADEAKAAREAPREWYRFVVAAAMDDSEPASAELTIFDEIGGGVCGGTTAKDVVDKLAALPSSVKTVKVRVNSKGGDVWDALGIAGALRSEARNNGRAIDVMIEGLAASAATIITSAGDSIGIADHALMMVHQPTGFVVGRAQAMRDAADALDRIRDSIIAAYRWRSPLPAAELGAMVDAQTWMNADEAIAKGFATHKVSSAKAVATFDRRSMASLLQSVPDAYRAALDRFIVAADPPKKPDSCDPNADGTCPDGYEMGKDGMCHMMPPEKMAKAVVRACRDAGFPELADDLLGQPMAQVTARLETAKASKAAADKRAADIRALCATAKFADLAEDYIRGGMSVDAVRAQLTTLGAKRDAGLIDATPPNPHATATAVVVPSPTEIYRARAALPAKGATT